MSLLVVFSCKKKELQLLVQGNVRDPNHNISISGAQVVLSGQIVSGGSFNNNFSTLATATTSGNGQFELSFPRENVANYRLEVSKNNYFKKTIEIVGDAVQPDEVYYVNVEMLPIAHYKLRLQNSAPSDPDDRISYRNLNADLSCECCNNQMIILNGELVDTTFICAHEGESWLRYWYEIEENGSTQAFGDSVFLSAFDTTSVTIEY